MKVNEFLEFHLKTGFFLLKTKMKEYKYNSKNFTQKIKTSFLTS